VGSNISLRLRERYPSLSIVVLDNLVRNGSQLNVPRLKESKIIFIKGDVRNAKDLGSAGKVDLIIECSAECSVLSGYGSSARYLIDTNLGGAVNCLEFAHKHKSDFLFLSTSRVYPIEKLKALPLIDCGERLRLDAEEGLEGIRNEGVSEDFSLSGARSFYGASKLAAELLIEEYVKGYGLKAVINRCGVIAGPWQMGKIDQGFMALWVASHIYNTPLSYIGFNGRQVRDVLHIEDLYNLIERQMLDIDAYRGNIFNVGGGIENSVSLRELTTICERITGAKINISNIQKVRQADIPYYVTDFSKVKSVGGWFPQKKIDDIVSDIARWIFDNKDILKPVFE